LPKNNLKISQNNNLLIAVVSRDINAKDVKVLGQNGHLTMLIMPVSLKQKIIATQQSREHARATLQPQRSSTLPNLG